MYAEKTSYMDDVIKALLDGRKYLDISENMKVFVTNLFGDVDENAVIKVSKPEVDIKPNLYISIGDECKNVTVKTGKNYQFHIEDIKSFILFLRSIGVSSQTQKTLLYFHYGDGTMTGTGKKRYNSDLIVSKMKTRIKDANEELNSNPEIVKKVVDRFVFQGIDVDAKRATHIYYGDADYGVTISQKQMEKWLNKKKWKQSNIPHIGPFFIRPQARYVDKKIVSEFRRNHVIAYWSTVVYDMQLISDRYHK